VSDVTDIVAFIRARLDEDERIARASGHLDGHSWTDSPVRSGFGVVAGCDGGLCENDTADAHLMHLATSTHIARHDPARVLREVAAKRRTLAWHAGKHWCTGEPENGAVVACAM